MEWAPRLRWHRSSAERENDFHADLPDGEGYCRVYLSVHRAHPDGQWYWCAAVDMKGVGAGFAQSARDGAKQAEEAVARARGEDWSRSL